MWFEAFSQTKFSLFSQTQCLITRGSKLSEASIFASDFWVHATGWTSLDLHLDWKFLTQLSLRGMQFKYTKNCYEDQSEAG